MWTALTVSVACMLGSALKSKKLGISAYLETGFPKITNIEKTLYYIYIYILNLFFYLLHNIWIKLELNVSNLTESCMFML